MNKFLILLIVLLGGCGISESDYKKLETENQRLKEELSRLADQKEELDYLKDHSEVLLSGTLLRELTSSVTGGKYNIKIWLPRDYRKSSQKYPVLYVTDAETNFGGITYIVQRLIKDELIPPVVVVGIAYGTDYDTFYALRSRDLTPVEDKTLRMGRNIHPTGGAEAFSKFLEIDLFPFIEQNFRAKPEGRAIYGHSYGGLFGTYLLLNKSSLFDKYLILSPSLWYHNEIMLAEAKQKEIPVPVRVFLASGELEGRIDDLQIQFVEILEEKGLTNLSVKSEILENETHRTIFGAGFTNGLRYLYGQQD